MAITSRWREPVRRAARSLGSGRRELAIAMGAYGLYSLVRGVFGGSLEEGRANAEEVIALEKRLGIFVEQDIQRFFIDNHLAMPFWNVFYPVSQVVVLPLTLYLVYRYRRDEYPVIRNLAILSWCAGLVWYSLQPVAPPRLAGVALDTVTQQTVFDLNHWFIQAFYNPVAAMPSLHVGMAPVVAVALWSLTGSWWTRTLGLFYPFLVATSIVVTGNHYLLDIAGGLAVVLPAAAISFMVTDSAAIRGPRLPRLPRADAPGDRSRRRGVLRSLRRSLRRPDAPPPT
jgi:membrane-associated phospholipid phosphatase